MPADANIHLDLDLQRPASVAEWSTDAGLPPPDGDTILIVTGLPRSGTPMMMQMLEAGGLPILMDGERAADESNPRGYWKLEAVKRLGRDADASWLNRPGH